MSRNLQETDESALLFREECNRPPSIPSAGSADLRRPHDVALYCSILGRTVMDRLSSGIAPDTQYNWLRAPAISHARVSPSNRRAGEVFLA